MTVQTIQLLARLTPAELSEKIGRAQHPSPPIPNASLRPAAVLVPLVSRRGAWHLLLTRRAQGLRNHNSQVAFPGGRCEETDGGAIKTALRETREEVGIASNFIHILGVLPQQPVVSGYLVTPVVGVLSSTVRPRISPDEIERVFYVPLSWLAEPSHVERIERHHWGGIDYPVPFFVPYEEEIIWGMTARIILSLVDALKA